jgi:HSP20 family protein
MFNTMLFDDVQQTLDHLRQSMDQLFGRFYGSNTLRSDGGTREFAFSPAVETDWDDDALHLRAIVPGVSEKELKATVQNGQLVIEGERKAPETAREGSFRPLAYGKFYTAVTLPGGVDVEKISCRLENGILDVTVPVAEQSKPKQIPIESGSERKALAA